MAILAKSRNSDSRERDVVTRLRQQIEQAIDSSSDASRQRARAWKQFSLQPNGTEEDARSKLQSADVNTMVTAIMAQMVISFSTDTVCSYEANSAEDEQAAKMESAAVNRILIEQNGGYVRFVDAAQNALLYREGVMKVYWAEQVDQFVIKADNVDPVELPVLVQSEVGIERRLISYDPDTKVARVDVTTTDRRLALETVDNALFFIDPDFTEKELRDCPLCGEVLYKTRDELSRQGIDWAIVKALPAVQKWSGETKTDFRPGQRQNAIEPLGHQNDIVRTFEAYARIAWDEDDDRATLYKCLIGDNTPESYGFLTAPEPVSRIPYASGSAFPIANRHQGEALAEKLYSVQEGKTELFRQLVDNIQVNSIGRYGAVVGQVELSDIMTPKAGQPIRMKSPNAIVPIPVADVGDSIIRGVQLLNQEREERGGAALDMVGSEQQLAQETAAGTERVYASKELLVSYMLRNLAEGLVRQVYLLGHEELRAGESGPISVKIGEQWQQVDPSQWPARTHCNVKVGYSMGERRQISNTLFQFIGLQQAGLQAGMEGQLVTKQGLYKSVVDWLNVSLIDNPEAYLVDPSSPQAQQAAQMAAQMAQQNAQQQAQILGMPEQIKAQATSMQKLMDLQFQYFKTVFEGNLKTNETEVKGNVDVVRAAAQAKTAQAAIAGRSNGAGNGGSGGGANGSGERSDRGSNSTGSNAD